MAIELLGYDYKSAAQNLSTTINVPAGTTYMLATCNGYGTGTISVPSVDGDSMTQIVTGNGGTSRAVLFGLANPTTGSTVSITASVSEAYGEGLVWEFAFFSGVDTSNPVRDSDTAGNNSTGVTNTLDCQTGDYAFVSAGGDAEPSFTANVTQIHNQNNLSQIISIAGTLVSSGTTITVGTTNGNYSTNVCCTLIPDAGSVELSGTITASSTIAGTLKQDVELDGLVEADGTAAGTLSPAVAQYLSGTIPASSGITGAIEALRALAGSISGSSALTGTLNTTIAQLLSGTIAASSEAWGILSEGSSVFLSGTIPASSDIDGAIRVAKALAGIIEADGTIAGTLSEGQAIFLAGTIPGSSGVSGAIQASRALAGLIAGSSTISGRMAEGKYLAGVINGVSTLAGIMSGGVRFSGEVEGSSGITGAIITSIGELGVIEGDYYFDSNTPALGGGKIRYYNGIDWVEATPAFAGYAAMWSMASSDAYVWSKTQATMLEEAVKLQTAVAKSISEKQIVTSLPASPYTGYSTGDIVVLSTNSKLYRLTSSGWTNALDGGDLADYTVIGDKVAANAITAEKIIAGARNSPNDPEAWWTTENIPEIPDDPAGIVGGYLRDDWTTGTDSWTPYQSTLSFTSSKLIVTATGTLFTAYRTITSISKATIRIKLKSSKSGTFLIRATVAGSPNITLKSVSVVAGIEIIIDTFSAGAVTAIVVYKDSANIGDTFEIDWVYIGTGAYLPDSLVDSSGNANHGTIYGATPDGEGGLVFDGVNDRALVLFSSRKVLSLGAWFNVNSYVAYAGISTLKYNGGSNGNGINLSPTANNVIRVGIGRTGTTAQLLNAVVPTMSSGWHFILTNYDETTRIVSIFIDGIFAANTSAFDSTVNILSEGFVIGNWAIDNNAYWYNGTIRSPRIYNRALTEAEIKYLYENKGVTGKGMIIADQIAAGSITSAKIAVADLAANATFTNALEANSAFIGALGVNSVFAGYLGAQSAMINALMAQNVQILATLRAGGRYNTDGSVDDDTLAGVFMDADGNFKVGSEVGELSVDAATGDVSITDMPIRSYAGEGVQRRATQLDNDSLDFYDSPVGGTEQLRARISRLGVGGAILMDGTYFTERYEPWSAESVINAAASGTMGYVIRASGEIRIAYYTSSGIYERVLGSTGWGTASLISGTSGYGFPNYCERSNGDLHLSFCSISGRRLAETIDTGSGWSAIQEITASNASGANYIETIDGVLRLAYRLYDSGASSGNIVEKIYNDSTSTWGTESTAFAQTGTAAPEYLETRDGVLHLAYKCSAGQIAERILTSGSWGSETIISTTAGYMPAYYEDMSGDLRLCFSDSSNIFEMIKSGDTWGDEETIATTANYPAYTQCPDGSFRLAYMRTTDSYLCERTLQRYAQIGAGIIESGSNEYGSYVKYGDGTMECWGKWLGSTGTYYSTSNYFGSSSGTSSYRQKTITWPAAFVGSSPAVHCFADAVCLDSSTGLTTCTMLMMRTTDPSSLYMQWRAIGRWRA